MNVKKKYIFLLALLTIFSLFMTSCNKEATPQKGKNAQNETASEKSNNDESYFIGFSAGFTKVQHWQLEVLGAETAAKEAGAKFVVEYANGDPAKQVSDVENMAEKGIDMLIVGPADSQGFVPTIKSLQSKGIKVGTSDIGVIGADVAFHVASDNYTIGVSAAEQVAKELDGKGKIAIVGWATASATADREAGFVDTITEKYPAIEIILHEDVQSDRQKSLSTCESIIEANSDIDLIFGANAECALGAYAATQSVKRTDILVVAVDTDSEVMDAVIAGTNLVATVAQDPYTMGYEAASNAIKYMKGEKVENIAIPHEIVTKENAQEIIDRDQNHLKNAN